MDPHAISNMDLENLTKEYYEQVEGEFNEVKKTRFEGMASRLAKLQPLWEKFPFQVGYFPAVKS